MPEFVTIKCPEELLPQVVGELLALTYNPDAVEVVGGADGREILVHPLIADAWFLKHNPPETPEPAAPTPAPEPVPPAPAEMPTVAAPPSPKPSTRKTTSA